MSKFFSIISAINPSKKESWAEKIFVTFDTDWAADEVLFDCLDLVCAAGVPTTWFVTHETSFLRAVKNSLNNELGIHPNFNPLLDGSSGKNRNAKEIIHRLLEIVPEAKSIRSHSMTQSSRLLELFMDLGLTHEVNHFIPNHIGIKLRPWFFWNNLCKCPYFWEDDVHLHYESIGISQKNPAEMATTDGLKIFDFHPIHVFLNTECLDRYERTRSLHRRPKELIKHRYKGYGTRSRLIDLLKTSKKKL